LSRKKPSTKFTNSVYVGEDELTANPRQGAIADIPDTSIATAEDVGDKVNEILAALRKANIIEE